VRGVSARASVLVIDLVLSKAPLNRSPNQVSPITTWKTNVRKEKGLEKFKKSHGTRSPVWTQRGGKPSKWLL